MTDDNRVTIVCPVRGTYKVCRLGPPAEPIMWRARVGRIYKDVGPYQTWFEARNAARLIFGDRPQLTIEPCGEA